jgi:hypothetical protein
LTNVRAIGNRLSVTVRFKDQDHVTLLEEWKPPPTVAQVLAALTAAVGHSLERVGGVDVGDVRPQPLAPPASTVPLLSGPSAADQAGAVPATDIVGTLDAVEDAQVVVAGLRVIQAPGVSVAEDVPVGASVTVAVEKLRDG